MDKGKLKSTVEYLAEEFEWFVKEMEKHSNGRAHRAAHDMYEIIETLKEEVRKCK